MKLSGKQVAQLSGAEMVAQGSGEPATRAVVDSRSVEPGDLFVGLLGEADDGGRFARDALVAGAWGALVAPEHAGALADADADGWVLAASDPLAALQALARGWHRELGARVVGITGSTGKTSVKDICRALLGDRVHASPENYNTEVGLPLAILMAPPETEVLVLEMAMRGPGQIAELCGIAEPDIAVVTNIGPVHLELLGTIEAIAAAKAEIIAALVQGGTAVVPAERSELHSYLERHGPQTITFGDGGEVHAAEVGSSANGIEAMVQTPAGAERFSFPFPEAHNLTNALAAIAVGVALEVPLGEMSRRTSQITFSPLRGELIELDGGATLINDCYNANPMSMRAALDHLGSVQADRRIAVLGEMAELGPGAADHHREIGEHAREAGIDVVVGVGAPAEAYRPDKLAADPAAAAALLRDLVQPGDAILIKGSRSAGLEAISDRLAGERD